MLRRIWIAALLPVVMASFAVTADEAVRPLRWMHADDLVLRGDVSAVAVDAASEALAVADAGGVWLRSTPGVAAIRVLRRAPVGDLLFLPDGSLLAATARGLYAIGREGDVVSLPVSGEITRLAGLGSRVFGAGPDGVHWRDEAGSWRTIRAGLHAGAATAIAVAPEDDGSTELWVIVEGRAQGFRIDRAGDPRPLPADGTFDSLILRRNARDLAVGFGDVAVAVLTTDRLLLREAGGWSARPLPMPPGAEARRLGWGAGRFLIATDRALLVADDARGPWRRAELPAGGSEIVALAGRPHAIYAGGQAGVLVGRVTAPRARTPGLSEAPVSASEEREADSAPDPPVAAVQHAALRYLALTPERMRQLRRGVMRRGWLPELEVDASWAHDRQRSVDHDQVFSSGALRRLADRSADRQRELQLGIRLAWDLGDLVYHPETIDVSREAREVIELRDEVLDEVNQLYFERQRTLRAHASEASADAAERHRLGLRADELAAGLDAWTGGWFSLHRRQPGAPEAAPDSSRPVPGMEYRP